MYTNPPDWLDILVQDILERTVKRIPAYLSESERLYVALATSRVNELRCSIPSALARIGPTWSEHLAKYWQYT